MDESSGVTKRKKQTRRRPALACVSCRESKIRCDRQHPCGACSRSRHKKCVFTALPRSPGLRDSGITSAVDTIPRPARTGTGTGTGGHSNSAPITPASTASSSHRGPGREKGHSPSPHQADLVARYTANDISCVLTYEEHPSDDDLGDSPAQPDPEYPSEVVADANGVLCRLVLLDCRQGESTGAQPQSKRNDARKASSSEETPSGNYITDGTHGMNQGVVLKTRYFGRSHWMHSITHFNSILDLFSRQLKEATHNTRATLLECKAFARTIKGQHHPGIINKLGTTIPCRNLADKLVDGYLGTLETVFRVVHVPSFKRDYEQYWTAPQTVGMPFIIQLQLIMAIGSTIYDDVFSMRKSAIQWVTEAEHWLMGPSEKSRLSITGLQNMILLMIARETCGVSADMTWIHVGSLLRTALYMGLHRDPSRLPKMSPLDAEMRRRLWNTILELELKTSLDSGGFPTVSLDASDTRAPADIDDSALLQSGEHTDTNSGHKFTDMTAALALRESFRERLAICQILNATPHRGTYEDTIQLHQRFLTVLKSSLGKLASFKGSLRKPTAFQCRLVEILTRRFLMSLHLPYVSSAFKDPAFSFSRKQTVESAVKICQLLFPSIGTYSSRPLLASAAENATETFSTEGDDVARFSVCGSGFFRLIVTQSSMTAINELHAMMQEDEGIGPPTPRPDLLNILRHCLVYYRARLRAGETNVKGLLFSAALAGHVQAMMEGETGSKAIERANDAVIQTEAACLEILRQRCLAMERQNATTNDSWDSVMQMDVNWGDTSGPFFNLTSVESFLGTNDAFDFPTF